MFCDLVDSTILAERLDDEEYREVMRAYYDACTEVIRRHEGHIASYQGDGLMIYFGYPHAHEDDAERAVRAGLDVLTKIERELNPMLAARSGTRLSGRIGIHTGSVVVGDLGGAGREALAIGETVNLAHRLQSTAAPNTVVISGAALELVRGIFIIEELGSQWLKGVGLPIVTYRVLRPSGVRSRLDGAAGTLTSFVGRRTELGILFDRWERAQEGDGQAVLITGEAGIGKSRLVLALREQLSDQPLLWIECRCSPYTVHSAFQPVIELIERALALQAVDTPAEKIEKLERALEVAQLPVTQTLPLMRELLSIPASPATSSPGMSAELKRRTTLQALVAWSVALSQRQTVLILVEDLQWCDPSSLELLGLMIEESPRARLMIVGTAREDFSAPWPPSSNVTILPLNRLTKRQAREMVEVLTPGRAMPEDVMELIVGRSDAVPLYLEELTRMMMESQLLADRDGQWRLRGPIGELVIPATLRDSLMARLDRLGAAKAVAQRGAVLGREFSYALLAAASGMDEQILRRELTHLVDAGLVFQRGQPPGTVYTFKHALIQETAYRSLLRRTRQEIHARVAQALADQREKVVDAPPEVLGRHYEAAGLPDQAVAQYQRAGARAAARSANEEATNHLRRAIALIPALPEGPDRDGREGLLHIALGLSLIAARGYAHPETGAVFERARRLCEALRDPARRAAAFLGLSVFNTIRGELQRGVDLARAQLAAAREMSDTNHLLLAHVQIAVPELYQGKFASSLAHCEEAIAIYDPSRHGSQAHNYGADQGVAALANSGWSLWYLGYPDRGLARAREAVTLARTLRHSFTLAFALFDESVIHWLRRDPAAQLASAEEAITISEAHGFPLWLGVARVLRGGARAVMQQDVGGAVAEVSEGLALTAKTGARAGAPGLLAVLAEAHRAAGQTTEAMAAVEMGLRVAGETGQPHWDAELYRLKAEILISQSAGEAVEAEALFRHALEIAQAQQARSLELRVATSLAMLLQRQGDAKAPRMLLAPLYAWFSEGFSTRDLREAKTLLAKLD